MRAFFAVDLPDELADGIEAIQNDLRGAAGLRFTEPDQAHVTLTFLGDVPDDELDDVIAAGEAAVAAADTGHFTVTVGGLGVFPSLEYISVVWAGIEEGATELTNLHEELERRTTELGYDPENHEFTPHVTVARMDDARGKELVADLVRNRHPEVGRFEATELQLTESTLTDDGPVYDTVASFAL